MNEILELLAVIALLYLAECGAWIRRSSLALRGFVRRYRSVHPSRWLGNPDAGLVFGHPFPPLGLLYVLHGWPVSLSSRGAFAFSPQALDPDGRPEQGGRFVEFDGFPGASCEGSTVLVGSEKFVLAGSAIAARRLCSLLRRLATQAPEERCQAIEQELDASLDAAALRARVAEFERSTRVLRPLVNALFLTVFVVAPAVLWRVGLTQSWIPLTAGVALFWLGTLVVFVRAHRRLFPRERGDRIGRTVSMVLIPLAAIRARDFLAREALVAFDPVLAMATLDPQTCRRTLAHAFRDLDHPLLPECSPTCDSARDTHRWFWSRYREKLRAAVQACGWDPRTVEGPPQERLGGSRAFCPRCLEQFRDPDTRCDACGGRPLVAFPDEGEP